jgi:hypothetical protein
MPFLHLLCVLRTHFCEIIACLKYQGKHIENCATINKTNIFRQSVYTKGNNPFNQFKKKRQITH